jgi:hypothetical protein
LNSHDFLSFSPDRLPQIHLSSRQCLHALVLTTDFWGEGAGNSSRISEQVEEEVVDEVCGRAHYRKRESRGSLPAIKRPAATRFSMIIAALVRHADAGIPRSSPSVSFISIPRPIGSC